MSYLVITPLDYLLGIGGAGCATHRVLFESYASLAATNRTTVNRLAHRRGRSERPVQPVLGAD
jgi:hypothetical protein